MAKELNAQYEEQVEKLTMELEDLKLLEQRQRLFVKQTNAELQKREEASIAQMSEANELKRKLRSAQDELSSMRQVLS